MPEVIGRACLVVGTLLFAGIYLPEKEFSWFSVLSGFLFAVWCLAAWMCEGE